MSMLASIPIFHTDVYICTPCYCTTLVTFVCEVCTNVLQSQQSIAVLTKGNGLSVSTEIVAFAKCAIRCSWASQISSGWALYNQGSQLLDLAKHDKWAYLRRGDGWAQLPWVATKHKL